MPARYDPTRPTRLDVVLHGSSRPAGMSELRFLSRFDEGDADGKGAPEQDFIERHWRLPHDPSVEAYLGEFFHYTPGSHLLASLVGAWLGIGGLRAAHPLLALSVALKAGFVFLIARRVVPQIPMALAAVLLSFAAQAYALGSFAHDFFFAQVIAELFAVAGWWEVALWDDLGWRGALALVAIGGTATFLTWPIWIGPLLLTFACVVALRESLSIGDRLKTLAIGAGPVLVVATVYAVGRLGWLSIVRTSGGVTWPAPSATGWLFPLLALIGFCAAVGRRRGRAVVLFVAAIAAQAAVLFAVAKHQPTDTPYMALKMVYLAVYPLAVCGAIALTLIVRPGARDWIAWAIVAAASLVIGRQLIVAPRDKPVVSAPLYRAGVWARANVPRGCVEYLVANPDTAYWLHLAVLGNPRLSARTADLETFDEPHALVRWITAGGLPYAIADLTALPRDVRNDADIVAQFATAAVLKRRGASSCADSSDEAAGSRVREPR